MASQLKFVLVTALKVVVFSFLLFTLFVLCLNVLSIIDKADLSAFTYAELQKIYAETISYLWPAIAGWVILVRSTQLPLQLTSTRSLAGAYSALLHLSALLGLLVIIGIYGIVYLFTFRYIGFVIVMIPFALLTAWAHQRFFTLKGTHLTTMGSKEQT